MSDIFNLMSQDCFKIINTVIFKIMSSKLFSHLKISHQKLKPSLPTDREYMLEMERSLRQVNIDYQQVGFYQSTYLNTHCDRNFLDSVFDYLEEMNEAIALIYGNNWISYREPFIKLIFYSIVEQCLPHILGDPKLTSSISKSQIYSFSKWCY